MYIPSLFRRYTLEETNGWWITMREIVTEQYLKNWKPGDGQQNPPPKDDYFAKVLKLIPGEVVTLYIFLTGLVGTPAGENTGMLWVFFFVCLAAVPFYLIVVTRVGNYFQIGISTVAFVVWALALGEPFTLLAWIPPLLPKAILPIFTFFIAPFVR